MDFVMGVGVAALTSQAPLRKRMRGSMPRPEAAAAPPVFKKKRGRFLIPGIVVLVILAGAWIGGWFWLARWVDRAAADTFEKLAQRGVEVSCQNRDIIGFPFAIRVACGDTAVAEQTTLT